MLEAQAESLGFASLLVEPRHWPDNAFGVERPFGIPFT
jgi:hypothetical protein